MSAHRRMNADADNKRHTVVCDIDGVLLDTRPMLERYIFIDKPDWHAYNNALAHCGQIRAQCQLINMLYLTYRIVLLSNRAEHLRAMTMKSLFGVSWDQMILRDPGAVYQGTKRRIMEELMSDCNIKLAIEDDPTHVSEFEELGIPTLYIHSAVYTRPFVYGMESADVQD